MSSKCGGSLNGLEIEVDKNPQKIKKIDSQILAVLSCDAVFVEFEQPEVLFVSVLRFGHPDCNSRRASIAAHHDFIALVCRHQRPVQVRQRTSKKKNIKLCTAHSTKVRAFVKMSSASYSLFLLLSAT